MLSPPERLQRYRTIVADPPWDHSDGTGARLGRGDSRSGNWTRGRASTSVPYSVMAADAIAALPVKDLAEDDAHLYLWTTQRYLHKSFDIVDAWGFTVSATLVWCKNPPGIQIGGPWRSSVEFIHFAWRGNLAAIGSVDRRWFNWPRRWAAPVKRGETRQGMHSAKPEAFIDLVEQVSPGPYLELFARRDRLGWDTWGDESLGTAEVAA